MRKVNIFRGLFAVLGVFAAVGSANATSLLEVYQQALQSDPRIHEAEARRLAALEAEPQARGVLLPQINVTGDWTRSTSSGSGSDNNIDLIDDDGDPVTPPILEITPVTFSVETKDTTKRWQVSLRQTLFRWDQIVGLRRADKQVAKAEADREAAQQDLIIRVGEKYFDVLAAEDRLTSRHKNRQAIARQLEQAKQRFDVGLIAITDVQESQAAYDQAVADEIAAKRDLASRREFLREITGCLLYTSDAADDYFWV